MPAARIRRFGSAFLPMARNAPAGGPPQNPPAPGGGGGKEDEPGGGEGGGKVPVFGKEAIAGVDGVRAGAAGGLQDGLDVQIGLTRRGRPHANRRVSLHGMQAGAIGFGGDGHGAQAEAARRSPDAGGGVGGGGGGGVVGRRGMGSSRRLATSRVLRGRACPVIRMLPEEESLDISANPSGPSAWRSPASCLRRRRRRWSTGESRGRRVRPDCPRCSPCRPGTACTIGRSRVTGDRL